MSIEPDRIDNALSDSEVRDMAETIKKKHGGKRIIVCVDVLQRLSGGHLRMHAYEKLLSDNHNLLVVSREEGLGEEKAGDTSSKVVLIERAIRNNARPQDEENTSIEMRAAVEHINSKVSGAVDYEEVKSMSIKERLAFWLAADVLLLTSIREGLNLMPMEFIYARKDEENAGVIVASEFSTCSTLLNGALKVNPFNVQLVTDQIGKALSMDLTERRNRRMRDIDFVSTHPSGKWTENILRDIAMFNQNQNQSHARSSRSNKIFPGYNTLSVCILT